MELSDILNYNDIVIQCHDNPDADALASGFALYCWLQDHGRQPRFIYGGWKDKLKPNLQFMKDLLQIPVEHVTELSEPELLVMADCRYGEKNAQKFQAKQVCVIDHHQVRDRSELPDMREVLENYGSCSTVIYEMFLRDGYDMSGKTALQTALYYGLYMDTNQFQELWHPADKDMWDALEPDEGILNVLKNSNIASSDLTSIGDAFAAHKVYPDHRFAITHVHTRDRNILGIVSDTLLQVDVIDACVAYALIEDIYCFSARSCTKEIRADELVQVIAEDIGNAGGHIRKAAGVVFGDLLMKAYPDGTDFSEVLRERLRNYFAGTDTVYAGQKLDLTGFSLYRKLPVHVGTADLNKVFAPNTKVMLRTLEGDIDITVNQDQLLMIGVNAETYPISRDDFNKNYRLTGNNYVFSEDYAPALRHYISGDQIDLSSITQECVSLGSSLVYAKQLTRRTHVFTVWDKQKYIYGKAGDWIAVRKDKPEDVYIIAKEVFSKTYEKE